jgi:hypothetical protein
MKLFCRLVNAIIIYRNNTGKIIDQLPLRIQIVEGLSVKYANVPEREVPGRHSFDNTVL